MRLVTGSNRIAEDNKVSIRLRLNGHSFSKESAPALEPSKGVAVELLSMRSMLVPTANIGNDIESLLTAMEYGGGVIVNQECEDIVAVKTEGEMSAVVVVPSQLIDELNELYSADAISYSTPLLLKGKSEDQEVVVSLHEDLMVIKLFNGSNVLFCDIYEYAFNDDILYRLGRLLGAFDIPHYAINVYGGDQELQRFLSKYYSKVNLCE